MNSSHSQPKSNAAVSHHRDRTSEVVFVDEQLEFLGNIIPHTWLRHIKTSGHADVIACLVLGEIVFWYRGIDVKVDGKSTGRRRKFDADILQKSYDDLAKTLNLTKGQVKDAICRLEKLNLIKREFRTIASRGVKVANVLYIRLFPWVLRDICKGEEADPAKHCTERMGERCAEKNADLPGLVAGGNATSGSTSAGPDQDKYREHNKDYAVEHSPGEETSTSAEPALPAHPKSFSESEIRDSASATPGGELSSAAGLRRSKLPGNNAASDFIDQSNHERWPAIRPVLEQAFRGSKFTDKAEATLQAWVVEGRMTMRWAEAFSRAKLIFDQDRDKFKDLRAFMPYRPGHLISNLDLTADGMLFILQSRYEQLDIANTTHDLEDLKPFLHTLRDYENRFSKGGYFDPEALRIILGAGAPNEFEQVMISPKRFFGREEDDLIPPAWMRLIFAHRKQLCSPKIQSALLKEAYKELQSDPGQLKLIPNSPDDKEIREIFGVEYDALQANWQRAYELHDQEMAQLEILLAHLADLEATFSPAAI